MRARSVLARAGSAHVTWLDPGEGEEPCLVTRVVLDPPDKPPAAPGAARPRPVVVEIGDVAPLPVADRVRARVRLHGRAVALADDGLALRTVFVELEEPAGRTPLSPAELWAAEPDPIAAGEGAFLSHLATGHAELTRSLTRLVDREVLEGAVRASPLALDRYGLVLRVEYPRGHCDVRLPFPEPAASFDDVRAGLRELALRAHSCPRQVAAEARSERRGFRFLTEVFRAGPAAARICAPDQPPAPG